MIQVSSHSENEPSRRFLENKAQIPHQLEIQRATTEHMDKVASLVRSSASWYKSFVDPKDMDEHDVGSAWVRKNFELREFYLGTLNGEPVGTISLQEINNFAYLGYIYLNVNYVGRGFGHQLMRFAEQQARDRGLEGMFLIAHPAAKWATKAYLKFGFKRELTSRKQILNWRDGVLKPYYEEGFELYTLRFWLNK